MHVFSKTVFIGGDVPFLRALLKMAIEDAGYSVVGEASAPEEVLQVCTEYQPDVIILDIHMAEFYSVRLVEDILDINPTKAVIIVSDLVDGFSEKMLAAGARAFIQKPFSMYDLIDMIRKVAPVY